jgi:hypothetical protein
VPPREAKNRIRKADFIFAWIVSLAAIALYIGQAISKVQLADLLDTDDKRLSLLYGFATGMIITLIPLFFARRRKESKWETKLALIVVALLVLVGSA